MYAMYCGHLGRLGSEVSSTQKRRLRVAVGHRACGPIGCSAKVEREVIKEGVGVPEKYRYSCRFKKFVVGVQRSENQGSYCTTMVS